MNRQTLCLDFDGVIHSYENGWQDGAIYGHVTAGFWDWALKAEKAFDLVIYSTRSATPAGRMAIKRWLGQQWQLAGRADSMPKFSFASKKPPAWLTIDDRALCFTGDWGDFSLERLQNFRTWYARRSEA